MTLSPINNSTFAASSFEFVQNCLELAKTTLILKPLENAGKVRDAVFECLTLCGDLTPSAKSIGKKYFNDVLQYGPRLATSMAYLKGKCAFQAQGGKFGVAVTEYPFLDWAGYGSCLLCCGKAKITGAI